MSIEERDKLVYKLGFEYLYDVVHDKIPPVTPIGSLSIDGLYEKLLECAMNVGRNIKTIAKYFGSWDGDKNREKWQDTKSKLRDFDPITLVKIYGTSMDNWVSVWADIDGAENPPRTAQRFCMTIISSADFISGFQTAQNLYEQVNSLYHYENMRATIPLWISAEIFGIVFALACDFLKEIGYTEYPKPDVHLSDIFKSLQLAPNSANDYQLYKSILRFAKNAGATPYEVDKVFWLIGRAKHKPQFIEFAKAEINLE